MREEILEKIYKPARYLGNEWNVSKKDLNSACLKVALCFPDLYEVGMSHLGFRIVHGLLNGIEGVVCERVFVPAEDLELLLRKDNIPLSSLESNTPLSKFDIIGFSLSYELSFINVLNILELSNIPLKAKERNQAHPLIIAGGYACNNPEPVADFFDCFLIGEAEESILELIDKVKVAKIRGKIRKQLLQDLSQIEGLYAPCLYTMEYNQDGTIKSFMPKDNSVPAKIKKRVVLDLDKAFFPRRWVVPYIQIVHDRAILEIMRGCPNNCRFCQAKSIYHPYRVRSQAKIIELTESLLKNSGYEEISLLGLSCGDHPQVQQILRQLISLYSDRGIGISLPSLKAKNYISNLPFLLTAIKRAGLTFAPEAGSERLRRIINKNIQIKALFKIIKSAYTVGYRHIKLYFMIGLPYEELKDLDAIVKLAADVVNLRKKIDGKFGSVTLSICAFSPKPHTAFERLSMDSLEELKRKRAYLYYKLRRSNGTKAIKMDFHDLGMSFIETVLSRSDRKVNQVIYNAFKLGARGTSGKDRFNFDLWLEAFHQAQINPYFYANRKIGSHEILSWDHIDTGVYRYIDPVRPACRAGRNSLSEGDRKAVNV